MVMHLTSNMQTLCNFVFRVHAVPVSDPPTPSSRVQTDGRLARRDRTVTRIVDAHVALLREGHLLPTAAVIAENAGVSVRTLWAVFGDMEGLLRATTGYWLDNDETLRRTIDPAAPLPRRIAQFCAERVRRLESISPAARAASLMEHASEALRVSRRRHVDRVFGDVAAVFATELAEADEPDRLRDAITVAVSWNAWSFLLDDAGRSVEEATATMRRQVEALLQEWAAPEH